MQGFEEEHTEVLARVVWARKRPSLLWLVGAGLAFTAAVAITALAAHAARSDQRAASLALEREAAEIGRAIDATLHAAHDRADSIASTPMLRAAVLTDAATVADLLTSELKLDLAPGEVAELFQIDNANLAPLIRMPASAAALPALGDRGAAIARVDVTGLRVVVAAHIDRYKDGLGYDSHRAGMLVLSAPVDLAAIRRQLANHAADATLGDPGASLQLVHGSAAEGDVVRLAVPSETPDLTLTVAPLLTASHIAWLAPARNASLGLGALLVIAFAVIRATRKRLPQRR
jgi:hypothetical protein